MAEIEHRGFFAVKILGMITKKGNIISASTVLAFSNEKSIRKTLWPSLDK